MNNRFDNRIHELNYVMEKVLDAMCLSLGFVSTVEIQNEHLETIPIIKVKPDNQKLKDLYRNNSTAKEIIDTICTQETNLSLEKLGLLANRKLQEGHNE